jgi:ATP-binding cassette subfamily B (MDR/TAP) protein 1
MDGPSGGVPPADEKLEELAPSSPAEKTSSTPPDIDTKKRHHDDTSVSESTSTPTAVEEKVSDKQKNALADTADIDAAFAHLPEEERQILKSQLHSPVVKTTFFGLYRYADVWDYSIIAISALCSIAAGAALPLFTVSLDTIQSVYRHRNLPGTNLGYRSFLVN